MGTLMDYLHMKLMSADVYLISFYVNANESDI